MNTDPIVIVGLARTPMGAFQGELKGFAAAELGAAAIRAAVERAQINAGRSARKSSWAACCPPARARHPRARLRLAPAYRSPPAARRSTRCAAPG